MRRATVRKILTLLATCGLVGRTNGQVTLTANDLPAAGTFALLSRATGLQGLNPESTGPNQIWDFRDLTPSSQLEVNYVLGLTTPYAFFFAQNFGVEDANLGFLSQLGAIPIGGFDVTLDNPYLFFSKNAARYTAVGRGVTINGFPAPFFYSDPDEIYHFPLFYQRQDVSTFRFNVQLPTFSGGYRSSGRRTTVVDGWGTVVTPTGTYQCLRLKSVVAFNDTLDVPEGLPLPIPIPITQIPLSYTRTEYQWLAPGEGVPIAQVNVVSNFNFQFPFPIIPGFGGFSEVLWRDVDRRPVAAFSTVGSLTGCAPLSVKFVNESLRADSYRWNFGDGRTSVDPNPTHIYTRPGDYSVTLT
ncbi:MAG: PKD domain-containing protein, partial [Bacteroidia bacterium]|nr:PKD domain-containing protein [Bacteroidia bacterium]MDW8335241.1 PKD domain-containing protein [Bacteroidia bacterium]